ncbi:hypothetical protein LAG90_15640 [Marinilongibacter aquaticus]|uniref:AAA family ATPase n=1 Tax=Marinilongibacter aquaticus TaxID=2975157 RepID=UPI0021BDBF15|nr:hypothetical protein [Marinilongibacter aquaticus]UBM58236.1 hypothetical protein LAG90_15640 [Marinilongibacter aquaticus]
MRYKIETENGYDFYECSSALQKSIRRGSEDEAMFWAVELFISGFQEYIWKRLKIMSSEDIGLAVPSISSEIQALYEMHREQAKKKDDKNQPQRLFLTHAVLMLCRAKKSRMVDWALIFYFGCHKKRIRPIPDYALDKHNERGRKMGRGWKHFFSEGTQLAENPETITEEEYKEHAKGAIDGTCGYGLFD